VVLARELTKVHEEVRRGTLDDLARYYREEATRGEVTVVVAHGGAIRSYVSSLTAVTETHAESLFTPTNTSITHVAMTGEGPLLLDYAVAPHLETIDD